MMIRAIILIVILFLTTSCTSVHMVDGSASDSISHVSMMKLIVSPEIYNGKNIKISGFLSFKLEDVNLYFSEEAFNYHDIKNRVNINLFEDIYDDIGNPSKEKIDTIKDKYRKFHKKFVLIEGIFKYVPQDPRNPLRIINVNNIEIIKERNEIESHNL